MYNKVASKVWNIYYQCCVYPSNVWYTISETTVSITWIMHVTVGCTKAISQDANVHHWILINTLNDVNSCINWKLICRSFFVEFVKALVRFSYLQSWGLMGPGKLKLSMKLFTFTNTNFSAKNDPFWRRVIWKLSFTRASPFKLFSHREIVVILQIIYLGIFADIHMSDAKEVVLVMPSACMSVTGVGVPKVNHLWRFTVNNLFDRFCPYSVPKSHCI